MTNTAVAFWTSTGAGLSSPVRRRVSAARAQSELAQHGARVVLIGRNIERLEPRASRPGRRRA